MESDDILLKRSSMSVVCTLFEGNYHYGVGALVNSLCEQGFEGTIWAGYRGELPFWAKTAQPENDYAVLQVSEEVRLHFLPLQTDYHFTNYKPIFLLKLWEDYCPEASTLFYCDPDIIVKHQWHFFEEWASEHIALCEDVNSPLLPKDPKRLAWQRFFEKYQIELPLNIGIYANAGFIGLPKKYSAFLATWRMLHQKIAQETEQLSISFLPSVDGQATTLDSTSLFYAGDQDALNCAVMIHPNWLSISDKSAMDFDRYGYLLSHAIGAHKPWNAAYLKLALDGRRVGLVHRLFWQYTQSPIQLYTPQQQRWNRWRLQLAAFITNFYSRA